MPPRPVYLDCDTGIDDALALAYLLASPEVHLAGVGTVHGNTDAGRAAVNTLDLLALAGRLDVPVAVGAGDPLTRHFAGGSASRHGRNGIGDVELPHTARRPVAEPAADLLVRLAARCAGELDVIALGPLTNLAVALAREPAIATQVRTVFVAGGGAVRPDGSQVAHPNTRADPEAAAAVLQAPWRVVLVPLQLTRQHVFDDTDRLALAASGSPLLRAVAQMLDHYIGSYAAELGRPACLLHDPLAAALAVGEVSVVRDSAATVTVDVTDGHGRGQTCFELHDRSDAHTRVVLEIGRSPAPVVRDRLLRHYRSAVRWAGPASTACH